MKDIRYTIRTGDRLIHLPSGERVIVLATHASTDKFSVQFEETNKQELVTSVELCRVKDYEQEFHSKPLVSKKEENEALSNFALQRENKVIRKLLEKRRGNADLLIAKFQQWIEDEPIVLELPVVKPEKDNRKIEEEETAVLVISDVQLAKRTPTYNMAVAEERLMLAVQKTIRITEVRRKAAKINKIKVFFVGDLVEGEQIFPHQPWETEAPLMIQACREGPRMFAQMLMGLAQEFESVETTWVSGNHGRCHDVRTELLTREGWKRHDKLRVGELVATYNTETGCSEWQPLKKIHRSYHNGEMVSLENRYHSFSVTPNHDMLGFARPDRQNKAERKSEGIWYEGFTKAKEFVNRYTDGHFLTSAPSKINTPANITDDEIRLAAWIATDGSVKTPEKGRRKTFIYQSKPQYVEEIRELLTRMDVSFSEKTRSREPVDICGVAIKTRLQSHTFAVLERDRKRVLDLVPEKYQLPEWVWELDSRQFGIYLDTLIKGDGSTWKEGRARNLWGTEEFLDQVQALCIMNGVSTRVLENERGYCLSIRNGNKIHPKKDMKSVPYSGLVWCGETDNQTLITRRDGCPLISGNSGHKHGTQHPDTNWDSVAGHCTRGIVASFPDVADRIKFDIVDDDWYKIVDVDGWGCLLFHGHQIRGGLGAGGNPFKNKIQGWSQVLDKPFNYSFHGHFHNPMVVAVNDIICYQNGTTESTNRFAQELLAAEGVPMQWLMYFNKRHGLISENPLWLEDRKPAVSRKSG
jgi:hypothetical protein